MANQTLRAVETIGSLADRSAAAMGGVIDGRLILLALRKSKRLSTVRTRVLSSCALRTEQLHQFLFRAPKHFVSQPTSSLATNYSFSERDARLKQSNPSISTRPGLIRPAASLGVAPAFRFGARSRGSAVGQTPHSIAGGYGGQPENFLASAFIYDPVKIRIPDRRFCPCLPSWAWYI